MQNHTMPPKDINNGYQSDLESRSCHSNKSGESDIVDVELAPLKGNNDGAATPKDVQDDMTTTEWISFHAKKNGKILSACATYSFCSVTMVLVNKSLASSYNKLIDGSLNILLVVFQAIVAIAAVKICNHMKWIDIPAFSFDVAKQWAPVNIFFCAMLFTGMASLQYNSVPMVTIFKNVSNITTAIGDYYFFGNKPENLVIVAFVIMLLGAVAAVENDISLSFMGLVWMLLNCISSSGYVLYMKHATETIKLEKFGMVFYNNVLCVCFLLPAAVYLGETRLFWGSKVLHTADYAVKNVFAGLVGFFLNFAALNCVAASGATTYVIIGSLNKIPVAFLGYWIFKSVINKQTWFFIAVSMCGGFLYSYAKLQSSASKRTNRTN